MKFNIVKQQAWVHYGNIIRGEQGFEVLTKAFIEQIPELVWEEFWELEATIVMENDYVLNS